MFIFWFYEEEETITRIDTASDAGRFIAKYLLTTRKADFFKNGKLLEYKGLFYDGGGKPKPLYKVTSDIEPFEVEWKGVRIIKEKWKWTVISDLDSIVQRIHLISNGFVVEGIAEIVEKHGS